MSNQPSDSPSPTDLDLAHYEAIKLERVTLCQFQIQEAKRHQAVLDAIELRQIENQNACQHPRRNRVGMCMFCGKEL